MPQLVDHEGGDSTRSGVRQWSRMHGPECVDSPFHQPWGPSVLTNPTEEIDLVQIDQAPLKGPRQCVDQCCTTLFHVMILQSPLGEPLSSPGRLSAHVDLCGLEGLFDPEYRASD